MKLNHQQSGTYNLPSRLLGRTVEYCVILPEIRRMRRKSSAPLPVFYLLHGLFGRFDNWLTNTKIIEYAEKYSFAVICPDGGNGWYSDSSRLKNHFYESWLADEFVPHVETIFNVGQSRAERAVGGLSMGGYGAFKLAFRRPRMFGFAASMSGAFHAVEASDDEILKDSIDAVFGDDEVLKAANDLFRIAEDFPPDEIGELPYFYFDCGARDNFLTVNQRFHELLARLKIAHQFDVFPGGHDWNYWNSRLENMTLMTKEFFSASQSSTVTPKLV